MPGTIRTADLTYSLTRSRPRVAVAMLGARMHYALPRILHEAGSLERFYTDSYIGNKHWLESILMVVPDSIRPRAIQRWLARKDETLPEEKVVSFEAFGWIYACLRYRARTGKRLAQIHAGSARCFNKRIIASNPHGMDTLWGLNGACVELFRWSKKRGIRCIVEQTSAPQRLRHGLIHDELVSWPKWQTSLETLSYPNPRSEREEAEWGLADVVVAGSEFVAQSLLACNVSPEKVRVVPYGVDTRRFRPVNRQQTKRLRLLFAGEVGLIKGVPYFLQALRQMGAGRAEVRFAGNISLAPQNIACFRDVAEFLGPVPRTAMRQLFEWADILVLPSIVEGSAIVTYEALASGLPVITTPNAGSVVRDGVDGFIVPIRDADAIRDRIEALESDRGRLHHMSMAARKRSMEFSLERYRDRLLDVL